MIDKMEKLILKKFVTKKKLTSDEEADEEADEIVRRLTESPASIRFRRVVSDIKQYSNLIACDTKVSNGNKEKE